ncbi:MAG: phenylalanine--tRNA ligase subunit alpha, partial [Clostridia bacterium]
MKEQIEHLINECDEEIRNAENKEVAAEALQETKIKFLGKNGKLTAILRGLKDVSPSERPLIGQLVNEAREKLEKQFLNAETKIKNKLLEFAIKNEYIDITADLSQKKVGSLHPLSIINNAISNIFIGMGFEVLEGPEIETDYYNFQALNIP